MSAATNNLLVVEQRLWTLVAAWPALSTDTSSTGYVRPNNRVRFDQLGVRWPNVKGGRNVADAPELELDIDAGRADPRAPRTFCLQPDVSNVPFVWTVTVNDQRLNAATQVLAELKACFIDAGTQLGIPTVVARWEWAWRTASQSKQKERRIVATQTITIKG